MASVISPASLPQQLFLTLRDGTGKRSKYATEEGEEVDIIFYGGQAGGGKSFASLLHHMKYNEVERYKGVTIRRTTPMLTKPGAIWDEAKDLYKEFDPTARIRNKDMKISFGPIKDIDRRAEVSFTHFERVDDTDNFQGLISGPFTQQCVSNKLSKRGTSLQDNLVLKRTQFLNAERLAERRRVK